MKNIENIKIEKTFYKRNRDAFGNVTRDPYQSFIKRPVNVVTPGIRFAYYIIDAVILGLLSFGISYSLLQLNISGSGLSIQIGLFKIDFIGYIISFIFYATFELVFQATPGKLMLGYTVIDEYAKKPESGSILLRTLIRWVPFEAFSCLSDRGWHDTWSKTYVVKKEEKEKLNRLLGDEISSSEDLLD